MEVATQHQRARIHARPRTGGRVFHHCAPRSARTERRHRCKVHVGRGLGARHLVPAEDAALEVRQQAHLAQLDLDLVAVGTRSAGNTPLQPRVHRIDRGTHVAHGLQITQQRIVAALAKRMQPVFGERVSGVRLDQRGFVLDCLAHEQAHAFGRREQPAGFGEHVAQYTVGDRLAVHQYAIAIEQHRLETHVSPSRSNHHHRHTTSGLRGARSGCVHAGAPRGPARDIGPRTPPPDG